MEYYIGLDVSQRQTAICIIDGNGNRVKEGKALTVPSDIYAWIIMQVTIEDIVKVGHEAGAMSFWLQTELTKLGLPIMCLEAFEAAALLETQRNKTDKNDARGLAQIVRMGGKLAILLCSLWLREKDFCWTNAAVNQELAEVKSA